MTREETYLAFLGFKYPDWEFAFVEPEDVERRKSDGWSVAKNPSVDNGPETNKGLSG